MSLIEKYPTMHPDEEFIERCLKDPFNKSPGGKRRHPKYSLCHWRFKVHRFAIQRNNQWRKITVPETDYLMRNWINDLFRSYASIAWIETNNYRITKYFDMLKWHNRRVRQLESSIHHRINQNIEWNVYTECEVADAMYRYFTRCTNGQHLEREY